VADWRGSDRIGPHSLNWTLPAGQSGLAGSIIKTVVNFGAVPPFGEFDLNKQVKIAVAIGLLVIAGGVLFWFSKGTEETAAKAAETKTLWMCQACSTTCELTAKEVDVLAKESGPPTPPLLCQKCREKKVFRAVKCPKCGTPYFTSDVPDSTGVCPKCNPDAPKASVIEDQKEAEEAAANDDTKAEQQDAAPKKPKKKLIGA
jgi:hypothetical protein